MRPLCAILGTGKVTLRTNEGDKMRTGLSREEIIRLLERGFTRSEVAEMYQVTPQAVNWHLNAKGRKYKDPRQRAMEHLPWKVESRHKNAAPFQKLRMHIKYVAVGEKKLSESERKRLRSWYEELQRLDVVLEYDPNIPPTPRMSTGGWRYVPRADSDEGLIIRVNEHTRMTDEAYEYLRFPEKWPEA